jgi:hypothetical protein
MRPPSSTPCLVPDFDITVHVVLDDFGKAGRAYREIDEANADAATIVDDLLQANLIIRCGSSPSTRW